MKKKPKSRNTLAKQIKNVESQTTRQMLAKYGKQIPWIGLVEVWQKRVKATPPGQIPFVAAFERIALFDLFMGRLVRLEAEFFYELAEAIAVYKKQSEPEDEVRLKLSNPGLWLTHPLPTPREVAQALNYKGNMDMFRKLLRELNVPHAADRAGRPRKTQTAKGRKSA